MEVTVPSGESRKARAKRTKEGKKHLSLYCAKCFRSFDPLLLFIAGETESGRGHTARMCLRSHFELRFSSFQGTPKKKKKFS